MAIQFESIQDPFGIATGGTILGKMLQEQNQQKRDIAGRKELQTSQEQAAIELQKLKNQADIDKSKTIMEMFGISPSSFNQSAEVSQGASPLKEGMDSSKFGLPDFPSKPILNQKQLSALAFVDPQAARVFASMNKEGDANRWNQLNYDLKKQDQEFAQRQTSIESDRKYFGEAVAESEKKISGLRESLPKKTMALSMAKQAVDSGEVGAFSLNNLAEIFGRREFLTSKGAQLITAGKENMLSNMSKVSAKGQNQWFEQRLSSMFPQIGQSIEANQTMQTMLEGENAMDQVYLKNWDRLLNEDQKKYGDKPSPEAARARQSLETRARQASEIDDKKIFSKTNYKIRKIYEQELGESKVRNGLTKKVSEGTPLTLESAAYLMQKYKDPAKVYENAVKLGYTIPSKEEMMEWER